MIFDAIVYASLLLFAAFLFIYDIKLLVAPQKRGRVVAIEDQL
jgi:multisubunit Na+/H+ antiporter MnhF subunit